MRPTRHALLALTAAVLLLALVPAVAAPAGPPRARVWLPTGDRESLLAEQAASALGPPVGGLPSISDDPVATRQRLEGFGASSIGATAHVIARSPHGDEIVRSRFDPKRGLGLSCLRRPMGAWDFVAAPHDSYDDVPAGQSDFGLRRFSIAPRPRRDPPAPAPGARPEPHLETSGRPGARRPG